MSSRLLRIIAALLLVVPPLGAAAQIYPQKPIRIIMKLNQEIGRMLALPEVREKLLNIGMEPESATSEQFSAFIRAEIAKWAKVVKTAGIRIE